MAISTPRHGVYHCYCLYNCSYGEEKLLVYCSDGAGRNSAAAVSEWSRCCPDTFAGRFRSIFVMRAYTCCMRAACVHMRAHSLQIRSAYAANRLIYVVEGGGSPILTEIGRL